MANFRIGDGISVHDADPNKKCRAKAVLTDDSVTVPTDDAVTCRWCLRIHGNMGVPNGKNKVARRPTPPVDGPPYVVQEPPRPITPLRALAEPSPMAYVGPRYSAELKHQALQLLEMALRMEMAGQ